MSDPIEARRNIDFVSSDAAEHVRKMVLELMDTLAEGVLESGEALNEVVAWVAEPMGVKELEAAPKLQAVLAAFGLLVSEIYLALATDRVQLSVATRAITSASDFVLPKLARDIALSHIEEMRREGRDVAPFSLDAAAGGE